MSEERKKIAFFSKGDDKFIEDIISRLALKYETKKITIAAQEEMKRIDQGMEWADICWFEWCDGLLAYGSKLAAAEEKKIICRLHSYEAFTNYPFRINWRCVDKLVFVSEGIRKYVTESFGINKEGTIVIPNGVDPDKWSFRQRRPGFKIAFVGYINYKKGPMLLLHTFKALYDRDNRYQLYIAGQFQDPRYSLYFSQMVREFGLENNYFFEGWQKNIDEWLEDKDYILCTSLLESQNMSVMQAMAKGIKPVVHNFAGAKGIYDKKYLWNTIGEAVGMITEETYDSAEYRDWITKNYSFEEQYARICCIMDGLTSGETDATEENEKSSMLYLRQRMNEFSAYTQQDFDSYDFSTARIIIGKREKAAGRFELIEFVLENDENEKIIISNVWRNISEDRFILPEQMQKSKNIDSIIRRIKGIEDSPLEFKNNMAGFIFDPSLMEDIKKNALAYIWERGIPGSQYLPLSVYLRIAERYIFAGNYMDKACNVLEAPCGFGYGAAYFSKLCGHVEAADIAPDSIAFAASAYRHQNIRWSLGDVTKLPYPKDEFDIYVSFEVFEHLPVETAARHIEEARRVIKDSGKFILSTPNREMRKHIRNPFHTKEYAFDEFREILEKYFGRVEFYSMTDFRVEKGMKPRAYDMIAVCGK